MLQKIYHTRKLIEVISLMKNAKKSIGFVPTMGALHEGHLELVARSKKENDLTICSIFVNPLQFNKQADFDNYPITLSKDLEALNNAACDVVFLPTAEELYDDYEVKKFELGELDSGMEATHRPGHFQGMANVIYRFFQLIRPTRSYFGEKDYQQLAIVRWLSNEFEMGVEVVGCATVREESGLALSSRNLRLSEEQTIQAQGIYSTLKYCKNRLSTSNISELKKECREQLMIFSEVEYFEIADEKTLKPIVSLEQSDCPRAFLAVNLGEVRLIDNLSLIN